MLIVNLIGFFAAVAVAATHGGCGVGGRSELTRLCLMTNFTGDLLLAPSRGTEKAEHRDEADVVQIRYHDNLLVRQ